METKELTTVTSSRPLTLAAQSLNVMDIGKLLAQSGYFQDVRDMSQAVAKILAGQELGIGPITSLTNVYIVQGRPSYSANVIAAVIKRSGVYNFKIKKLDNTECILDFYENGKILDPPSKFTIEDARIAELLTGKNAHTWKHYPRNMLFARALTNGQKWHCPDVAGGLPLYTPEELGEAVTKDGEMIAAPLTLNAPAPILLSEPEEPQPSTGISYPQQKRLFALAKEVGVDVDLLKKFMAAEIGVESTKQLSQADYEALCGDLESGEVLSWFEKQQERPVEEAEDAA